MLHSCTQDSMVVIYMTDFLFARSQTTPNDNDVFYQLQQLFHDLKGAGGSRCVSTVKITRSLSIKNGEWNTIIPTFAMLFELIAWYLVLVFELIVCEQQDAVEWFEKILSAVPPDVSQVLT